MQLEMRNSDLYIEEMLKKDHTDNTIIHLRSLQDGPDLIPQAVIDRQIALLARHKAWTELARSDGCAT